MFKKNYRQVDNSFHIIYLQYLFPHRYAARRPDLESDYKIKSHFKKMQHRGASEAS